MILERKLNKHVLAELNAASIEAIKRRLNKCHELVKSGNYTETTTKWINYYETYLNGVLAQ